MHWHNGGILVHIEWGGLYHVTVVTYLDALIAGAQLAFLSPYATLHRDFVRDHQCDRCSI